MPVTTEHKQYEDMKSDWELIRTVMKGERAVKEAGTTYLPMLTGQESSNQGASSYAAYKTRAMYLNATARTVQGLTGAVMRRPIDVNGFDSLSKEDQNTIGHGGESLFELARSAVEECLSVGRVGFLVDAPLQRPGETAPKQPYIAEYFAENIVNWRTQVIDGQKTPVLIVLKESEEVVQEDGFEVKSQTVYRVLRLVKRPGDNWEYQQEIWEPLVQSKLKPNEKTDGYTIRGDAVTPKGMGGRVFSRIPFVFINPTDTSTAIHKPPSLDLANVNLSHYRTSADLEHGRHYTALPTPWAAGFDPEGGSVTLGAEVGWVTNNENAKFGFLEFTGKGLGHLADGLEAKEKLMAILGARLLEQPHDNEAADTVRLRHEGEQSALANISMSVSEGFTKLLRFYAQWRGNTNPTGITVTLNQDFSLAGIDPATINALMGLVQNGMLSWTSLFDILKRGEMIPAGVDEDAERAAILSDRRSGLIAQPGTGASLQQVQQRANQNAAVPVAQS